MSFIASVSYSILSNFWVMHTTVGPVHVLSVEEKNGNEQYNFMTVIFVYYFLLAWMDEKRYVEWYQCGKGKCNTNPRVVVEYVRG